MKQFIICIIFLNTFLVYSQITYNPFVTKQNNNCQITKIELTNDETIVTIKVPSTKRGLGGWIQFSSATIIVPSNLWDISEARKGNLDITLFDYTPNPEFQPIYFKKLQEVLDGLQQFKDLGWLIRNLGEYKLNTKYSTTSKKDEDFFIFTMHFDRLPRGCENVYIRELVDNGFEWVGIKLTNPYPTVPIFNITNEDSIKSEIDKSNDKITGIYEFISGKGTRYKLACMRDKDNQYKLIYIDGEEKTKHWKIGEIKAILEESATIGIFKAKWCGLNKQSNLDYYIQFDGKTMTILDSGQEQIYLKMYPKSSKISETEEWSGTGFALKENYIVTNYHVIENAKTIKIKGINSDFTTEYSASIIAKDQYNDIAILQINDTNFIKFKNIPYTIKSSTIDVGSSVWTIGYPLQSIMGNEIKFTDGKISSKSGIQGDLSVYQISIPIQHGNSGSPILDDNGHIIGIASSGLNREIFNSENVNYAIKSSYLINLIESTLSPEIIPTGTVLKGQTITDQIKTTKNYVFLIKCSK